MGVQRVLWISGLQLCKAVFAGTHLRKDLELYTEQVLLANVKNSARPNAFNCHETFLKEDLK